MLRKKGIIFLAVLAVLVFVLSWLFTDTWLESQLEDMGSSLNGARVEIDHLDFSIIGVHLKWQRLQIADAAHPMKNKFETGPCTLDFEFWPLLSKKIIISDFSIRDVRTNTPRDTDGRLSDSEKKALKENSLVQKGVSKISSAAGEKFSALKQQANTDSLLKMAGLRSPARIDSLYTRLDSLYSGWEKRSAESNPLPQIKQIEKQIAAIDVEHLKDVTKLTKAIKQTVSAKKSIDKLSNEMKALKKDFDTDYNTSKKSLKQVDDWIKSDYKRAANLLQMPDFSAGNIGRILFGSLLTKRFTEYLGYVKTARKYVRKYQAAAPKEKDPPRLKGQDIYFYSPNARPDFWIQTMHISGSTADSLMLQGTVKNIVSNQKLIAQPTAMKIGGNNKRGVSLDFDGTFNYLQDIPQETMRLNYSGFSLKGNSALFPAKIESGTGTARASLNLNGNRLKSRIDFSAKKIAFATDRQKKSEIQRMLIQSIRGADKITATAEIGGTIEKPDFHIRTNLDKLLTAHLKERFGSRLKKERAKIEAYIQKQTASKRKRLETFAAEKGVNLNSVFSDYENALQTQQKKLDKLKKELRKKLDKQKNKLGKDTVKKLKDLF